MADPEDLTQDLVGATIGPYTIVEALGAIGLADRYVGRTADGTERMLGFVGAQHPELLETLAGMGLERVRHPSVLQVHEVLGNGRQPVLVTDLVQGVTLRDWLTDHRKLEPDEVSLLFRGICEAVGAIHKADFVHSDLRPENVLVVGGPPAPLVYVMDLGIAAAVFSLVSGGRSVTTSGSFVGKPHYWAPERARKPQSADARSDLFSLGCILYELFAGKSPFAGLNLYDCYHATLEGRYVPLTEVDPKVPSSIDGIVSRLLAADPDERIQTVSGLLERLDVHTLVGDDPPPAQRVPTPTPSGSYRVEAPPPAPRAPPVVPVAVGVAVVVALALAAAWAWLA